MVTLSDQIQILLRKGGGSLSMVASFLIMRDVYNKYQRHGKVSLTSSIVFVLSAGDFFSSLFVPVMGTWLAPKESGAYMAVGNNASCTVQGFFGVFFYGTSILSNTSLALACKSLSELCYFAIFRVTSEHDVFFAILLKDCFLAKRGWSNVHTEQVRLFVVLPPLLSAFYAIIPLFDDAYNYNYISACEIAAHPPGCSASDSNIECTRGSNARIMMLFLLAVILLANLIVIASVMVLIQSVLVQERKMDRYAVGGMTSRKHTIKTTWQGIWYIIAFGVTWVPWFFFKVIAAVNGSVPSIIVYIHIITFTTQGVWNAIVYFRPRYKVDRETHKQKSRRSSVLRVLRISGVRKLSVDVANAQGMGSTHGDRKVEVNNEISYDIESQPPRNVSNQGSSNN